MKQWWIIEIKGNYVGKCHATLADIKAACGPWIEFKGRNCINIFSRPNSVGK